MSTQLTATISPALEVPQREAADWDITVLDGGSAYADLVDDTLVVQVKDSSGASVILKSSAEPTQIEIASNVATLHIVGGDTEDLTPGGEYWFDAWVWRADGSGRVEQVITRRRFTVAKTVHEPDVSPPDSSSGTPLGNTDVWRRFIHTWTTDGYTDTVTLPAAMLDAVYHVNWCFEDVDGDVGILSVPSATRTATEFVFESNAYLLAGTTIRVELVDA